MSLTRRATYQTSDNVNTTPALPLSTIALRVLVVFAPLARSLAGPFSVSCNPPSRRRSAITALCTYIERARSVPGETNQVSNKIAQRSLQRAVFTIYWKRFTLIVTRILK